MKKNLIKFFVVIFISFFMGGYALANSVTDVVVSSDDKISSDFIQAGENIDVAGDVAGDAILAGGNISFSGNADGDILILGGNIRIKGNSLGDVRSIGGTINLSGLVEKNVTIIGGTIILEEDSVVKGNVYIAGESVELRGKIEGDVSVYSNKILFSGDVAGDSDFRARTLNLRSDSNISGNLVYSMQTDFSLENDQIVQGEVSRVEFSRYLNKDENENENVGSFVGVWQFLSLLLLGFILFKLLRKQAKKLIVPIRKEEIWNKIASGLISLIFNPVIIIISFISVIGIPLGLLLLFLYILLFISASVLSPVLVGNALNDKFSLYSRDDKTLWIDFLVGYIIIEIVKIIPVIGGIAVFMLFLFSFGRITRLVWGVIKENR